MAYLQATLLKINLRVPLAVLSHEGPRERMQHTWGRGVMNNVADTSL